ncbi:MAG: glycoside hydrolase family 2 protein, partial [Vallitaleaceae bacterium]|nr:glycoside hydrolase family 2 protein [Vallitaleaceae bacterium]
DIHDPVVHLADLASYNLYYGWYVGELEDNDAFFDEFHQAYPNKAIGLSEFGCEGVLKWQSSDPKKGDYSETYQALYHEHMCKMIEERPYIWASHIWNMFDFGADARDEGGVKGRNNKGLVTFDRKTKKDAFYVVKAYYSKEPFVHICGRRYIEHCEETLEIKVYSNQKSVALYRNGHLIEEKDGNKVFHFSVTLEKENNIEALSQGVHDQIFIRKVEKENPDYTLQKEESVSNWLSDLNLQFPEGHFSIKDKLGDLFTIDLGRKLIQRVMEQRSTEKEGIAASVQMSDEMRMKLMKDLTFESLLQRADIKEAQLIEINNQLIQIRK